MGQQRAPTESEGQQVGEGTGRQGRDAPTPEVEYANAFLETLTGRQQTVETYRHALKRLAEFIAETGYLPAPLPHPIPVTGFRDDLLVAFHEWMVQKRRYSPATIQTYLAGVQRFLVWLDAHDRLAPGFHLGKAQNRLRAARGRFRGPRATAHDPDPGLPRIVTYYDSLPLPEPTTRQNKLQRLKILRARAVVHTLYASAGRVSEVASLTREMVLDGRKREVRIEGKGGKERIILLTPEAQRAIADYLREREDNHPALFISHGRGAGKPLSRWTLWRIVKDAAKALGLYQGTSPHDFRHYRAQQLLHEGMDLDVLQTYLGHADISTTRRIYAPHTEIAKVRDQLETYGRSAAEAAEDAEA